MTPSIQQKDILAAVNSTYDNLVIQACAGSGKTTTLRLAAAELRGVCAVALAFAKVNAEAMARVLPRNCESRTIHSLGYRIIKEYVPSATVDEEKDDRILDTLAGYGGTKAGRRRNLTRAEREYRKALKSVASWCRSTMVTDFTRQSVEEVMDDLGIQSDVDTKQLAAELPLFLAACRKDRTRISFDDMVDHVVHYRLMPRSPYDVIFGDEVQDWNRQQAAFVRLLAGNASSSAPSDFAQAALADLFGDDSGVALQQPQQDNPGVRTTASRVILVGDRRQAIYAFRGANSKSMDDLTQEFGCVEMPLSVCYRCPKSVINLAQTVVGTAVIQPAETAEEGVVDSLGYQEAIGRIPTDPDGTMYIGRTNAVLVRPALQAAKAGRRVIIRGRDFFAKLEALTPAVAHFPVADGLRKVQTTLNAKASRQLEKDDVSGAFATDDVYSVLAALTTDARGTLGDAMVQVRSIFVDDVASNQDTALIFSTAHRAKGLEADNVVILGYNLFPPPWVNKEEDPEAYEQEMNLKYVAVTRAKAALTLVSLSACGREASLPSVVAYLAEKARR